MEDNSTLSETRQFKAIFPCTLNANGTLFGGEALKWMDEVAFITATRFTRRRMFTVNTENIRFLTGVSPDSIVEVVGKVENAGAVKLRVKVEIFVEEMYGLKREKAVEGVFIFAVLDENGRPQRLSGRISGENRIQNKNCSQRKFSMVAVSKQYIEVDNNLNQ